jgi:hypothetical protein
MKHRIGAGKTLAAKRDCSRAEASPQLFDTISQISEEFVSDNVIALLFCTPLAPHHAGTSFIGVAFTATTVVDSASAVEK